MTKLYQVFNDQHQPVKTFEALDAAKGRVSELRAAYPDEGFYVIELLLAYSDYPKAVLLGQGPV